RMSADDLVLRAQQFVRDVVIPSEPRPGDRLEPEIRQKLQDAAKGHGVFAPHVPVEFGGPGLGIVDWSPVFQAAGYSHLGPVALNCMAPDEGNMHMLELIATHEQKECYLRPLADGPQRGHR